MKINPEILSQEPTHLYNGRLVKVFMSTAFGSTATAEIMEGVSKGRWTTVFLKRLKSLGGSHAK